TTLANELTPAERAAFEQLVRAVGFAREVRFGHGSEARVLRDFPASVVYALTPADRVAGKHPRPVHEYRLLIAFADSNRTAPAGPPHRRPKRDVATPEAPKPKKVKRGTPEFTAKMREVGRAVWRKRLKKYGPTGFTPGREPWKMPSNIAYQKHAAKVARGRGEAPQPPQAPGHTIKTF